VDKRDRFSQAAVLHVRGTEDSTLASTREKSLTLASSFFYSPSNC